LRAVGWRRNAAIAATLALLLAATPARADEAADYWAEQTPARALVAALALQQAGHPAEAAAYYWIYLNTADLGPDEVSRLAALVGELFWTAPRTPAPEPAPPPAPRPAAVREVEPAPLRDLPRSPAPERARNWYGWQLILVDTAAIALVASGINERDGSMVTLGALTWVVGLPAAHWAHPRGGSAFLAFLLRGGGAALGLIGGEGGAAVGFLAGAAIDIAYLANQDPPPRARRRTAPRLSPTFDLRDDRMVAGLEVSF
jgi:hypothetical protein